LAQAEREPGRYRVLDASQSVENVQRQVDAVLNPFLAAHAVKS